MLVKVRFHVKNIRRFIYKTFITLHMPKHNIILTRKQVEPYFFETYRTLANVMRVDDDIDPKDWFIYTGIEAYLVDDAFSDPDFSHKVNDAYNAQDLAIGIVMEALHYKLGYKPLEEEFAEKVKVYMDRLKKGGMKRKPSMIYFRSNVVLFPTYVQHKEVVAHEAGHALFQQRAKINEATRAIDHEIFASFSSDYMLRKDGVTLESLIGPVKQKQDAFARVLFHLYNDALSRFDNFDEFVDHVRKFFHGRTEFMSGSRP
jgi:hypothetical protein